MCIRGRAAIEELAAGSSDDQTAAEVSYDNSTSGLTATDTQAAIDELATSNAANSSAISNILTPVVAGKISATGTAPLSEFNILSVVHSDGTGLYTINFDNDLGDTNYIINTSVESDNGANDVIINIRSVTSNSFTVEIKEISITDISYGSENLLIPTPQKNPIDKNWSFTVFNP